MNAERVESALSRRPRAGVMIGLLALDADATIEDEWRSLVPVDRAGFYTGRVTCDTEITPATLQAVSAPLEVAARSLLPGTALDVVAFACTSATLFLGEDRVSALIAEARPGVEVTTPLTAVKAALKRFQAKKVGVLTPYMDAINEPLAGNLTASGWDVVRIASFFVGNDVDVVRITESSIAEAARKVAQPPVEALVIACTGLRASALVPRLERELGIPVTTSNHALAWHSLALAGDNAPCPGRGRLFEQWDRRT